jgi:hypothetical protein
MHLLQGSIDRSFIVHSQHSLMFEFKVGARKGEQATRNAARP